MQKPFNTEFAKNGDKIEVLENGTATGEVNFNYGFTPPYEKDPQGINRGRDILRGEMNDILNKITAGINSVADEVDKWTELTTEDLNNVTQSGRYYQNLNINATNERNYPVNSAGYLIVLNTTINTWGVTQIYKIWNSEKVYIRRTTSATTWSAWDSLTLTTELNSAVTQLQNAINQKEDKTKFTNGVINATTNSNLNNLTQNGFYWRTSNTGSPLPTTNGGAVIVSTNGSQVIQYFYTDYWNLANGGAWFRTRNANNVWTDWHHLENSEHAEATYRKIADSYTKSQTDNLLNEKEDKAKISTKDLDDENLNDINISGFYRQAANAKATTALNYPKTEAGTLIVLIPSGSGNTYLTQTYIVKDGNGIFTRSRKNNLSWTDWERLALKSEVDLKRNIADSYTKAEVNNRTPNLNLMRAGYTRNNIGNATFTIPNSSIINYCNITISFRIQQQYNNTITFTFKNGNTTIATKALKRYSSSGQDYDVGDYCVSMCQFQVTSGLRGATITPSVSLADTGSGLVLEDICFNIQFQQ